jgi:hypothetical protein
VQNRHCIFLSTNRGQGRGGVRSSQITGVSAARGSIDARNRKRRGRRTRVAAYPRRESVAATGNWSQRRRFFCELAGSAGRWRWLRTARRQGGAQSDDQGQRAARLGPGSLIWGGAPEPQALTHQAAVPPVRPLAGGRMGLVRAGGLGRDGGKRVGPSGSTQ